MSDELEYAIAAKEVFASDANQSNKPLAAIGARLLIEFAKAEQDRRLTEERWLRDLRQYRGVYDPEVLALIGANRSKSFVRKTRVKVKTIDSRVEDLLFPAGTEKNWDIANTPVPSVSKEMRQQVIAKLQEASAQMAQAAQAQAGQQGQLQQPPPMTKEAVDKVILDLCKKAAKGMASAIDDQLTEVAYKGTCKKAFHSGHLFGTGIIKGPLVERRIRSTFVLNKGRWTEQTEAYVVPFVDFVPIWRFYPDMGVSDLADCRYVYERHQMTHADLADLAQRKSFKKDEIVNYLNANPQGQVTLKYVDNELKVIGERVANQGAADGKYEVLERWGYLTGKELKEAGLTIDDDRLYESFFSNIWLLPSGTVIKAVLQPINGTTWPYHMYYFDKDETSIFGDGIAAVMRDEQTNLNASTRLMLDNAAVSSGPMLEIATGLLTEFQKGNEVRPWGVFYRNGQNLEHPAVRQIKLESNLQDLTLLANRFEDNADEVSAIPRYMTGENVSQGAAGTSSGMSMLMGAANVMIKDLISNWDEGVTRPFITALYRWNMQFNPDPTIKGDFDVKARGTSSLVAREVRAQQLDNFASMTANPEDAPFIKRANLLRQRAEANELTDVVKTDEEVQEEQNNQLVKTQQQLQQAQAELMVAELQKKVELLTAQAAKANAEVDKIRAATVKDKVETVYSGLQAGGVATGSPHIAPAGDEILRSSGWIDATPDPSIAGLMQIPTGPTPPDMQGQAPTGTNQVPPMNKPQQAVAGPSVPELKPQTGQVGQEAGIETAAV